MNIKRIKFIIKAKIAARKIKDEDLPDWVLERRKICETCPFNSKNTPWRKRNLRWWKWHILNLFQPFCTSCGCELKALSLSAFDTCEEGYWPELTEEQIKESI